MKSSSAEDMDIEIHMIQYIIDTMQSTSASGLFLFRPRSSYFSFSFSFDAPGHIFNIVF